MMISQLLIVCNPFYDSKFNKFALCSNPNIPIPAPVDPVRPPPPVPELHQPMGTFFLKVHLPNNQYVVMSVLGDMLFADLLKNVCKRRQIPLIGNYFFHHKSSAANTYPMDATLNILDNVKEIVLAEQNNPKSDQKTEQNVNGDEEEQFENFMISDATQYKVYEVIKINKYGHRQERVMGIERDKIYNQIPKRALGYSSSKTTKRTVRYIEDVDKIEIIEDNPSHFRIEFTESNTKTHITHFEAKSKHEAAEIVARIKYLKDLEGYRKPHNNRLSNAAISDAPKGPSKKKNTFGIRD